VADLNNLSNHVESVVVYDVEGLRKKEYSNEELKSEFHASFKPELFKKHMPLAKYSNEWVLWKGSRLAIAQMNDGKKIHLALSYYGGFFKVLGYDGYFYFEGEAKEAWVKAFNQDIVQNNFIPKRIERNKRNEESKP
jgi:hypothetical protein